MSKYSRAATNNDQRWESIDQQERSLIARSDINKKWTLGIAFVKSLKNSWRN